MTTFNKLSTKYGSLKALNNQLAEMVKNSGGGATGQTAILFANASKDLMKAHDAVRKALINGDITTEQYQTIIK